MISICLREQEVVNSSVMQLYEHKMQIDVSQTGCVSSELRSSVLEMY
jgi:hypothetical protein